jgi:hypothetical protein
MMAYIQQDVVVALVWSGFEQKSEYAVLLRCAWGNIQS